VKTYTEFSNHDFIKSVIRFDRNEKDGVSEEEEKAEVPQKKRKRNGVSA
jgi:hypothetical protein